MNKPITWTIAGSDSSGGAGIQADLKTMNALGTMGCSVITALTAQNTRGIHEIQCPSPSMLAGQLAALQSDLPPIAIKIGMLGNSANIETIVQHLTPLNAYTVFDPVMVSSSGHVLCEPDAVHVMISKLLPLVHLLTPNLGEAETLLGQKIEDETDMQAAAIQLLKLGVKSVLIKGGHLPGNLCRDFWTDGAHQVWLTSPRQNVRHPHGTGCTLSSAIAACRALGYTELDAVIVAKAYVNHALRKSTCVGKGMAILAHEGWPDSPDDLPWIDEPWTSAAEIHFAMCDPELLGFYPIVDRAAWLEKLLPAGIQTIQLRIKNMSGEALEKEIRDAVVLARRFKARLFINDYWEIALKYGAYGVHLGQEDLPHADMKTLSASGIRLGVSVRSYADASRVTLLHPSYTAIGSVYATTSKVIDYQPLGLQEFERLRRLIRGPVVAIGGITLEKAAELKAAGADGFAMISDVLNASDSAARAKQWLAYLKLSNVATPHIA